MASGVGRSPRSSNSSTGSGRVRRSYGATSTSHDSSSIQVGSLVETDSLSSSNTVTAKWYCHLLCKYRLSRVSPRGAVLVLVWNLLVFSCISSANTLVLEGIIRHISEIPYTYAWKLTVVNVMNFSTMSVYPIAGWLADTYFGRYKVIRFSIWVLWFTTIILAVLALLLYQDNRFDWVIQCVFYPVVFVLLNIGRAGFQANVIPFGMDQMQGASGHELSAFIRWYFWTEYFGFGIVYTFLLHNDSPENTLIQSCIQALCMTVAISLDLSVKRWLLIEPASGNPLKIAAQVLRFAKSHTFPTQRSALTFWEDEMPSRIDLAKRRYGGPFSTEQVENVKTVCRMAIVLGSMCLYFFALLAVLGSIGQLLSHLRSAPRGSASDAHWFEAALIDNLFIVVIIIAMPLSYFVILPFCHNYILSSLRRIALAQVIFIAGLLCVFIIETYGHVCSHSSAPCFIANSNNFTSARLHIDYRWLVIPYFLFGLQAVVSVPAIYEFIVSQSPFSMRGFLIGLLYSIAGFSGIVSFLVIFAFSIWGTSISPSCGFWFYLLNLVLSVIGAMTFCTAAIWYKPRQRDDLSFEQAHVESHFDRNQLCV